MKRSSSDSPSPSTQDRVPPSPPNTPRKKTKLSEEVKAEPGSASNTPKKGSGPGWTPDKKEAVIEILLTAGLQATKLEDIADKLGLTKQQLRDATQRGKNNLRQKVINAARRV